MNIFDIENSIFAIYNELEENGGEFTPEIEEQLEINKENLKDKIIGYTKVIANCEGNNDMIDKEIERLKTIKRRNDNIIDKLKSILIDTVLMFGEDTKSGGKVYDYGLGKINISNSYTVEVNEKEVKDIEDKVIALMTTDEEEFRKYISSLSPDDTTNFRIKFDTKIDLNTIMANPGILHALNNAVSLIGGNIKSDINKATIKKSLQNGEKSSYCELVTNKNIKIK